MLLIDVVKNLQDEDATYEFLINSARRGIRDFRRFGKERGERKADDVPQTDLGASPSSGCAVTRSIMSGIVFGFGSSCC
jgi:hypothetical protein